MLSSSPLFSLFFSVVVVVVLVVVDVVGDNGCDDDDCDDVGVPASSPSCAGCSELFAI